MKQQERKTLKKPILNRHDYLKLLENQKITVKELVERYQKGLINADEWIYNLDGITAVVDWSIKGMWRDCLVFNNINTRWGREMANEIAKRTIQNPFG